MLINNLYFELVAADNYGPLWDYCLENNLMMPLDIILGSQSPRVGNFHTHSGSGKSSRHGFNDRHRSNVTVSNNDHNSHWMWSTSGCDAHGEPWTKLSANKHIAGSRSGKLGPEPHELGSTDDDM